MCVLCINTHPTQKILCMYGSVRKIKFTHNYIFTFDCSSGLSLYSVLWNHSFPVSFVSIHDDDDDVCMCEWENYKQRRGEITHNCCFILNVWIKLHVKISVSLQYTDLYSFVRKNVVIFMYVYTTQEFNFYFISCVCVYVFIYKIKFKSIYGQARNRGSCDFSF